MTEAFQLRCAIGNHSNTSLLRRDIAVSSVSVGHGLARSTEGAGRDALYLDLLNITIAQAMFDMVKATISVARDSAPSLGWIDDVYSLVAKSQTDQAMDLLLGRLNTMLERSEFEQCDSALRSFDFSRLDTTLMVSILSITRPARADLKARAEVVSLDFHEHEIT